MSKHISAPSVQSTQSTPVDIDHTVHTVHTVHTDHTVHTVHPVHTDHTVYTDHTVHTDHTDHTVHTVPHSPHSPHSPSCPHRQHSPHCPHCPHCPHSPHSPHCPHCPHCPLSTLSTLPTAPTSPPSHTRVGWLADNFTAQQPTSVSQGGGGGEGGGSAQMIVRAVTLRQVTDPTFYLTHTQYTDTGPTSPSTDPIPPGDCQGSHWGANVDVTGVTPPGKKSPRSKPESNPGCSALGADVLTTRPTRRSTQAAGLKALHQIRVYRSRGGRLNH